MKVLLAGVEEGFYGRDHALAWRLVQSPYVSELLVARGNAGTRVLPKTRNLVYHDVWNVEAVVATALKERVDFVVIGPEDPLVKGLADRLNEVGIPASGPSQIAAQLEGSKGWAIRLMRSALVPHPCSWIFANPKEALEFVKRNFQPCVVKMDRLAGGKGVWICDTLVEAEVAIALCEKQRPADPIVIQELRVGVEVSVFCFTDGAHISETIAVCDSKRRFDGDRGPNTGGMASFSPPSFWTDKLAQRIAATVLQAIVDALQQQGILYRGVLYAGLMLTASGPEVLEFNCRLGDPEAQVILPLLESDLMEVILACNEGRLDQVSVKWNRRKACAAVVLVDENYPDVPKNNGGHIQFGKDVEGTYVFEYGTTRVDCQSGPGYMALAGSGRRLSVVGIGDTLKEALARIEQRIGDDRTGIRFPGMDRRTDTGCNRDLPQEWAHLYA